MTSGDRGDFTMETQEDTVFIQNLPKDVSEATLAEHFGGIGVIKVRVHFSLGGGDLNP